MAEAFGIAGFHAGSTENCGAALDSALAQEGPALVEAVVDPYESRDGAGAWATA